ncbi:MAG: response regulator [Syntrophobacteraceae bacterium]|jgi:signal transduction histidine kinase
MKEARNKEREAKKLVVFGVDAMSSAENTSTGGHEILLVEDSPTQALELKLILEKHGYRISVAGNGREALIWLRRNRPAMVISDIVMPEIDGYELCRAIRKDEKLKGIPVILLSFLSEAADILKGLESGASNFIVKPYNTDYLVSYIREELSGKRAAGEDHPLPPFALEYAGRSYSISSNVRQILQILLATYETAVRKNEELIKAENDLRLSNELLEERVRERTAALTTEIAERRRVEDELRQKSEALSAYSAKLEQSNQELQDFVFVASHDLQEPLRKIQTFGDLVITRCSTSLDSRGKDLIKRMQNAANRMRNLVRGALEYSRSAEKVQRFHRVELVGPVQEAMADLRLLIEETDATIEIGHLPAIEAEEGLMRQLFQNLIGNSLKFRSNRRRPVIKIHGEECCTQAPSGQVCCRIIVEDNGIGFNEIYLDRIFKAFQRLHGRDQYEGTGVGLAICRKIVTSHNGAITAKSVPGEGSSFIVTLPLIQNKEKCHPDSEDPRQ